MTATEKNAVVGYSGGWNARPTAPPTSPANAPNSTSTCWLRMPRRSAAAPMCRMCRPTPKMRSMGRAPARHGVADVLQRLEQILRSCHARVVFDQRLFMGQADRDFVNARSPAQGLFDRAGA